LPPRVPSLHLETLTRDQYRQVAAWNYEDISDVDWDAYAAILEAPNRINYAVYADGVFCAYVALERFDATIRYHVAKQAKSIHPFALATLLLQIAAFLFSNGIESVDCVVPKDYRPSRRLALRCGMTFRGRVADGERYSLTKAEYFTKYGF
jgi:hypothetical protein